MKFYVIFLASCLLLSGCKNEPSVKKVIQGCEAAEYHRQQLYEWASTSTLSSREEADRLVRDCIRQKGEF